MLTSIMIMLAAAAAPTGADARETAAGKRDKMICKRFLETGSLVKGYRECKTKGEWEREREGRRQAMTGGGCGIREVGDTVTASTC